MTINLEDIKVDGYEKVVYAKEEEAGLEAIIAVHNTNLGPACGGVRLYPYVDREAALNDVLRLSKGMSYKSALAGIQFGGGKSVIIADPEAKSSPLFESFGRFVESFQGKYIAAKDMNVASADLMEVKRVTPHVLGIEGEKGSGGDPSPVTARAAFGAVRATWEVLTGSDSLEGVRFAIQGLGHVGYRYAELLKEAGAELWVTDIDPEQVQLAAKQLGATPVAPEEIYSLDCDVFAPCAIGAILNADTISKLKCRAIVGCANNQLETPEDGELLHKKGILYAPDYAVNSGGIINVFFEFEGYDEAKAMAKADQVYETVKEILIRSQKSGLPPYQVADKLAEERIYGTE